MSAKGEKIVGKSPVFIGQTGGASVEDVPLICDASLEVFNDEVSRLSKMDDDLLTYEVEVANIPCDSKRFGTYFTIGFYGVLCPYEDYKDDWIYEWNKDVPWDYEWYEALGDYKLKDEALRNKAIMKGSIKEEYDGVSTEELCEIQEQPVCNIGRYMMIKYSFNDYDEYVAVKEDEYDDLTVTRKEACPAYQEIFQIMDEGWMVTRAE
ncbi:hypothetical protein Tco_1130459 [Tanacetum coccineum]